jgi:hypothetical protein
MNPKTCCKDLEYYAFHTFCIQHTNAECPDNIIKYFPRRKDKWAIQHPDLNSSITIKNCPWCGSKL